MNFGVSNGKQSCLMHKKKAVALSVTTNHMKGPGALSLGLSPSGLSLVHIWCLPIILFIF